MLGGKIDTIFPSPLPEWGSKVPFRVEAKR